MLFDKVFLDINMYSASSYMQINTYRYRKREPGDVIRNEILIACLPINSLNLIIALFWNDSKNSQNCRTYFFQYRQVNPNIIENKTQDQ